MITVITFNLIMVEVRKTKFGILWNFIEKFSSQFLTLVINIILARLLTPHEYGTIGMLAIFLTFSNVFIDCGFSRALIQKQDRNETDYSTALFYNIIVSSLIYVILFIASPFIADFYKMPDLVSIERVFFLVLILNSLYLVQNVQLQIAVNFKRIALINTISQLLSGIIAIICAYKKLGVWALVIQTLSRSFICNILYWFLGKWLPCIKISLKSLKHLFNYGSKILVSGLLGNFADGLINMLIGKAYSPSDLGYYTRAQQFPEISAGTVASVLSTTTFPLLSSLQNNREEFRRIYVKLIKLVSLFIFPIMIGLAILSKQVILFLLGEKWLFASDLMFWLSLSYVFSPMNIVNTNVLNAIGRTDVYMKLSFIKIPFDLIIFLITYRISLQAVVISKALFSIVYFYINAFYSGKVYDFSPTKQLIVCWKYIISALIMGICVKTLTFLINSNGLCILVSVLTGALIYGFLLFILKDEEFNLLYSKVINQKHKRD